jgi:hypothetical protein
MPKLYELIEQIKNKAVKQHGDFNSLHEGYAVEFLWSQVGE